MTPQAWFDGFTEAVEKQPTQKQWARIKERVAEIDGRPVTEKVYVDRYLPSYPYVPYRWTGPSWYYQPNVWSSSTNTAKVMLSAQCTESFDSLTAMNALGLADAAALS